VTICCRQGKEHSVSIKGGEFDSLSVLISFSRKTVVHAVSYLVSWSYDVSTVQGGRCKQSTQNNVQCVVLRIVTTIST
jgi:hypothetical protein